MVKHRVLVVEADASRVAHWQAVVEFLGYQPELLTRETGAVWEQSPLSDSIAALVGRVGEHASSFARLAQHCGDLPFVLAGESGESERLGAAAREAGRPCWHLGQPMSYQSLAEILRKAHLHCAQSRLALAPGLNYGPGGHSGSIARVRRLIEQVAPYGTSVLVLGESGTGKERIARHIHELSQRAGKAFVPVNCGAIPVDLLESELFGHEKGAFTGAVTTRIGRFEHADGGTLFLDEIGDMSMPMQVKLLRVLQERTYERVGSNVSRACDVRIVAATHRDLEHLIRQGQFREDLYYRLNVFPIEVPPLRERTLDLPYLVDALSSEIARTRGAQGFGCRRPRCRHSLHTPGPETSGNSPT